MLSNHREDSFEPSTKKCHCSCTEKAMFVHSGGQVKRDILCEYVSCFGVDPHAYSITDRNAGVCG